MVDYEKSNYRIVIFFGALCVILFVVILIGTIISNNNKSSDTVTDTHSVSYVANNLKCSYSSNLAAISNGDKIGFVDRDKKFVIDYLYDLPKYDNYCSDEFRLYNFYDNYAIVYSDDKYDVINKEGIVVNTFDNISVPTLEHNDIKCVYVSYGYDVRLFCIDRNKIIDVVLDNVSLDNGKIVYSTGSTYINGDYLFYVKDEKKHCYNLKTDVDFEIGDYYLSFYGDSNQVPTSEKTLFLRKDGDKLFIKNNNYEDIEEVILTGSYEKVEFIPTNVESGKFYFIAINGDKFGIIDTKGNEIIPVEKSLTKNGIAAYIKNNKIYINLDSGKVEQYDFNGKLIEE